jgi:hypothetical protein
MTLALYGKTRRRQSTLILLAIISVFAAFIGGVSWHNSEQALAATTNINPSSATCSDASGTDDTHGALTGWDCTLGATAAQLSDEGSSTDDNSATGRVNIERDDSGGGTGTDVLEVTFPLSGLSGTVNSASISVWSEASDDPGVVVLGTASSETRYGSGAPSAPPQV